ncbi:hypothetical protein ElyMa_006547100 [Elysia marginata]|uniref:Uncharacterized protein n=1 Tax=Elysia marginata TaxID=1093978 RepID=A0AAV4I812_9GAST|nr:hypothetical protein ElyMa_006547100 [Elysia marginata]
MLDEPDLDQTSRIDQGEELHESNYQSSEQDNHFAHYSLAPVANSMPLLNQSVLFPLPAPLLLWLLRHGAEFRQALGSIRDVYFTCIITM